MREQQNPLLAERDDRPGFPSLRVTFRLALALTRARRGSLLVHTPDGLVPQVTRGISSMVVSRIRIPVGCGIAGWVAEHQSALLAQGGEELPDGLTLRMRGYQTTSFVSVPICFRYSLLGVINVADREGDAPFEQQHLGALILVARQAAEQIRLHQTASTAIRQVDIDPLTGLQGGRCMEERLSQEVARAARYGTPLSAMLIKLQCESRQCVPDGTGVSDRGIRHAGQMLREVLRASDLAFRLGRADFLVLMPNTSAEEAEVPGRRLTERLAPALIGRCSQCQSAGIGIHVGLCSAPDWAGTAKELVVRADQCVLRIPIADAGPLTWRPVSSEARAEAMAHRDPVKQLLETIASQCDPESGGGLADQRN